MDLIKTFCADKANRPIMVATTFAISNPSGYSSRAYHGVPNLSKPRQSGCQPQCSSNLQNCTRRQVVTCGFGHFALQLPREWIVLRAVCTSANTLRRPV
jgi:hypothetical protein